MNASNKRRMNKSYKVRRAMSNLLNIKNIIFIDAVVLFYFVS